MGAVQEIVGNCERSKVDSPTENCIDRQRVEMLEQLASNRATTELEQVLLKCEEGDVNPAEVAAATKTLQGLGTVPGTAASRLKDIAPEMGGLKQATQEAAAVEPPTHDAPADESGIDETATSRINEVVSKYENTPTHLSSTLGESGDQMPMSLKLYCGGGSAVDKEGTQKFAFVTSEYVPGAPLPANSFKSAVGWDDLDIYDLNSVNNIYQAAEFKVRGFKRGPGSCSSRDLKSFSFSIDRPTAVGGGFRYDKFFDSLPRNTGMDKYAELGMVLKNLEGSDVFNLVSCKPGETVVGRPCYQPEDPAFPYSADFPGFRQTPPGEFGVCLSRKDPETDLKKLSCAARALIVHMAAADSGSLAQTNTSSALIQSRADVKWANAIMNVGSVFALVLQGFAFGLEIAMTVVDTVVRMSLAAVTFLAGLSVDIATTPLIPLLGKNQGRKREAIKKFITGMYAIPLCIVTTAYSMVSYSMFALTYLMKHIAFFLPQHGRGSMQGSMHQSDSGQALKCWDNPLGR
jgi:hypothetical protein